MNDTYTVIGEKLIDLEYELRKLGRWETQPPSAEALESTAPFCIDTLEFTQWVQFVFIERMRVLVDTRVELPAYCGIAPMSEEYFRGRGVSGDSVTHILSQIDGLLSKT